MKKIHNLLQGSSEWHAFRACHFGASEASAMLGMSPYMTRTALLTQKKTGLVKEVNDATQRIFDKGHEVEKLAKPIVEKMIGVELSPMTISLGDLSASCDGLDFDDVCAWENKQFNKQHFELVKNGELPNIHWPQCQQVLLVTGAEKLFFTISDGTEENTVGVWVYPNKAQQQQIIAGWDQFKADLENFVLPTVVEKVEAETVQILPVPSVTVHGEITSSNLAVIIPMFDDYLASIKTELITDKDFANAEADAKNCRETASRIVALRQNIIAQMITVNEVSSILVNYENTFNKAGLSLEKAVKEKKELIKQNAVLKGINEYSAFVKDLQLKSGLQLVLHNFLSAPDFPLAIKGIKTIESMHSRISDALAKAKSDATLVMTDIKNKVAYIDEAIKGYEHLINIQSLATRDIDYIKLHIQSVKETEDKRLAEFKEKVKAQAEADAKAKLEEEQLYLVSMANAEMNAVLEEIGLENEPVAERVVFPSNEVLREAVIDHQDEIGSFIKSRNFGKDKSKIKAILVEFVKHQESFKLKMAA